MKILLAASEAVPFCKTGGLADVVGALAQKLGAAGHDVCLFLPRYRAVQSAALASGRAAPLALELGGKGVPASLRFMQWRSVSVCFLDSPPLFDRDGLYGSGGRDHFDNDVRFGAFCAGVLEGAKAVGFKPDVLHVHDWQTGLIPLLLKKRQAKGDAFFAGAGAVFTVHNMAYQGLFPRESLGSAGLEPEDFHPEGVEYYGKVSFLKAGLVNADKLTTVSPTYAREIQESSERGFGFEGLLRRRGADLAGVLNGIDLDVWNPGTDGALPRRFSSADAAAGKAECKRALRRECGLADDKTPLVAIVSRLDYQKGLDLALEALRPRLGALQIAALGTGDPALQGAFEALAAEHPGRAYFHASFDDAFAHRLYAACDLFLMPSRFEPCGLGQMIAMRYGGVPVASRTGGLADTVVEAPAESGGCGFLCAPGDAADLGRALDRGIAAYAKAAWPSLVKSAMGKVFSWDRSMERYLECYRGATERVRAPAR